jgi:alcohol dehydrogenase (cytochrome c)
VWSFNTGTGINAPPVSYAVNGKQYIAVLVGSKQPNAAPELKYISTASMLYVFALDSGSLSSTAKPGTI